MAEPNNTNSSNNEGEVYKTIDDDAADIIRILTYVNLLHIPLEILTNGAVLVIIYQIKRLHTPYNYIVFALATSDFMYILAPVVRVLDQYGDGSLLKGSFAGCLSVWLVKPVLGQFSLNMILLLSMDRFIGLHFSVWYRNHVNNSFIIKSTMAFLLPEIVFICAVASSMTYNEDEPNVQIRCSLIAFPSWFSLYFKAKIPAIIITVIILTVLTYRTAVNYIKRIRKQKLVDTAKHRRFTLRDYFDEIQAIRRAASDDIRNIEITLALVLLFVIFWSPITIAGFRLAKDEHSSFNLILYRASTVWQGFNFSVNSFVYSLSRQDFKVGFKFIFTNRPCKWNTLNRYITRTENFKNYTPNNKNTPISTTTSKKRVITDVNNAPTTSFNSGIEQLEKKKSLSVVMSSGSFMHPPRHQCTGKLGQSVSYI